MKAVRIIALIGNIGWILVYIGLALESAMAHTLEWFWLLLAMAIPALSLVYLLATCWPAQNRAQ